MVWTEIANLEGKQGPAGYNATGAAEDAAAVGAFLRATAGPNDANAALTELAGLNIRSYGGKGDGRQNTTAAMTSGSPVLTVSPGVFTAGDAGKIITVYGAGAAGGTLSTTIGSYTSATQVTLGASAVSTVAAAMIFWGTDNTPAIRAGIADAFPAKSIIFPSTGSGNFYQMSDTVTVDATRPNIRFKGHPRDGYAMSLRCFVANKTMFSIKAAGVVFEDMALFGDSLGNNGGNGFGATVQGIESFGDTNGNCDAHFKGVTLQNLAVAMRWRGRNNLAENCVVSNSLAGVILDGVDSVYHTGSGATQNRGNTVRQSRFHNVGIDATTAAIEATPTAKILHMNVESNFFDSNGNGRHIVVVGTAANPAKGVTLTNNKHTELSADGVVFEHVWNSVINGAYIGGFTLPGAYSGYGISLNQCTSVLISDYYGIQLGKSGIKATNTSSLRVRDVVLVALQMDSGHLAHGLEIDSTNIAPKFDNVSVIGASGYGFSGSPFEPMVANCDFASCALGKINSTTAANSASRGLNRFIETSKGRIEDVGVQSYDFAAGVAKTVATISTGGGYSTFLLEVEFTGNSAGNLTSYVRSLRVVNPVNGSPLTTILGADSVALATLAIVANGASGVAVVITPTNAVFGSVRVRTSSGGATSAGNQRGANVVMA